MPANPDAEKAIPGAILLDNAARAEAAEKLRPDDFSMDSHRRIYQRMGELLTEQRAVDMAALANELARYKEVEVTSGGDWDGGGCTFSGARGVAGAAVCE